MAGGIVITGKGPELRVLLVSNRRGTRWIFPKGRVKRGERVEAAALRETSEEAGVHGRITSYAGAISGWKRGRRVRTEYYLMHAAELAEPETGRAIRWCTLGEAHSLLATGRLRRLLLGTMPKGVRVA